ncbi:hypothetical protein Pmani_014285 [Petrolisthes manimaculis]|uniref:Uncharacterized protein n=1 Tax=Petrolisthes manimaculis TaxID=1843537 RepID=A0AAE1PVZ3_9EUCA|nr:hypothetical protein Pmani_014285 [Petrolisthes manimaculis]
MNQGHQSGSVIRNQDNKETMKQMHGGSEETTRTLQEEQQGSTDKRQAREGWQGGGGGGGPLTNSITAATSGARHPLPKLAHFS